MNKDCGSVTFQVYVIIPQNSSIKMEFSLFWRWVFHQRLDTFHWYVPWELWPCSVRPIWRPYHNPNELHTHLLGQVCPGDLQYKVGHPNRILVKYASEDLPQLVRVSDVQFGMIHGYPERSQSNNDTSGMTGTKVDVIGIMQIGTKIRPWITLWWTKHSR